MPDGIPIMHDVVQLPDRIRFKNPFLDLYMEYVEDTEPPRIFHIFAALTAIGACLGRRNALPWGHGSMFPNLYVALVGPPGSRKSTAISIVRRCVEKGTRVRFAPDDTGGQRQGLIRAMEHSKDPEIEKLEAEINAADAGSFEKLAGLEMQLDDPRDSHCMFVCASELTTFLGLNEILMMTFLGKMWDGENYQYTLKNTEQTLTDPLLSMLGGTTPQSIAQAFPAEAIGQGFMSRLLLVYGNRKHKSISRPLPLPDNLEAQIQNTFNFAFNDFDGEFVETKQAAEFLNAIYEEVPEIQDSRFTHYCERRQSHLIKIAMCLAAGRRTHSISLADVEEAHTILKAIEPAMPDALGEYGMSKLSSAKQRLVEFLQHTKSPVSPQLLFSMLHRDMSQMEFRSALADLCNAGNIMEVKTKNGPAFIYREPDNDRLADLFDTLSIDNN